MKITRLARSNLDQQRRYLPEWLLGHVVFPDGYTDNLSAKLKVLGQLCLVSAVVHVFDEDTTLVRVVGFRRSRSLVVLTGVVI